MSVCCECCVLPGRGLCDELITRPEEFYRMWCAWVWSCSLDNEKVLAHPGRTGEPTARRQISSTCGIHCCPNLFNFFCPTGVSILWRTCVYIYIYIYIYIFDYTDTVYELPLLPNNTAVKHFCTSREQCEVLTGYLSLGRRSGGDWEKTRHWTKHFRIPAVNRWPKCPNEYQTVIPFPVQRQLLCFVKTTEQSGYVCSHCLCCSVSEQLIPTDKHP